MIVIHYGLRVRYGGFNVDCSCVNSAPRMLCNFVIFKNVLHDCQKVRNGTSPPYLVVAGVACRS